MDAFIDKIKAKIDDNKPEIDPEIEKWKEVRAFGMFGPFSVAGSEPLYLCGAHSSRGGLF